MITEDGVLLHGRNQWQSAARGSGLRNQFGTRTGSSQSTATASPIEKNGRCEFKEVGSENNEEDNDRAVPCATCLPRRPLLHHGSRRGEEAQEENRPPKKEVGSPHQSSHRCPTPDHRLHGADGRRHAYTVLCVAQRVAR